MQQRTRGENLAAQIQPLVNRTNQELRQAGGLVEMRWVGRDGWRAILPLLASALVPGTGHMLIGRRMQGALALVITLALGILIYWALHTPAFFYLVFFMGSWLMTVHLHCYFLAFKARPEVSPPLSGRMLAVFLTVVILGQMYFFQTVLYGGRMEFELMMGYANVFRNRDIILVQPQVSPQDWQRGDIAMVNNVLVERVYALPGDRLMFENGVLSVNGRPLMGEQYLPITQGNRAIRVLPISTESLDLTTVQGGAATIPEGHLGLMVEGKIRIQPLVNIRGRVEAITSPPDRQRSLLAR